MTSDQFETELVTVINERLERLEKSNVKLAVMITKLKERLTELEVNVNLIDNNIRDIYNNIEE